MKAVISLALSLAFNIPSARAAPQQLIAKHDALPGHAKNDHQQPMSRLFTDDIVYTAVITVGLSVVLLVRDY